MNAVCLKGFDTERDVRTERPLGIRVVTPPEMETSFVDQWERLEQRALEPNMFLSPHFVLPALESLGQIQGAMIVAVERAETLVGLGVFEPAAPNNVLPLPHLDAFHCLHSFATGLLVDPDHAEAVVNAFLHFFSRQTNRWHGLQFVDYAAEGPLWDATHSAAERAGMRWWTDWSYQRAVLEPPSLPADGAEQLLSKSRRKTYRKNRKRLEQSGPVRFRLVRRAAEVDRCVDTFLRLEGMGWKGDAGTSLNSDDAQVRFFRDMAARFGQRERALFAELTVGDTVVASTANFISGRTVFAFKIGWHADYSQGSPGSVVETETMLCARRELGEFALIDSCSAPGSYIERIWPGRRKFTNGVLTTSRLGSLCGGMMERLRQVKRGVRSVLRQ